MTVDAQPEMATSGFDNANQYISKIGKYLRRTSLDEPPQLFNTLIGNMTHGDCIGMQNMRTLYYLMINMKHYNAL